MAGLDSICWIMRTTPELSWTIQVKISSQPSLTVCVKYAQWCMMKHIYAIRATVRRKLEGRGRKFCLAIAPGNASLLGGFPAEASAGDKSNMRCLSHSWALICVDGVVPATRMQWNLSRLPDATMQSTRRSHAKACLSLLHCEQMVQHFVN